MGGFSERHGGTTDPVASSTTSERDEDDSGTRDGLPIGLQIVGRRFDDPTVLRAAAPFEQARPWANARAGL
jgi:hypothetical protein